ncbi:MAG TPA: DUF5985 family protein [Candidatus Binatia bacterium]|nr:DUF5985 family protein [Candidatus Binatia bacterium]
MSHIFYGLCALAALFCTVLLLRAYFHNRYRLLMWGGLCFLGLTLNNALLVVDKFLFPDINLFTWRLLAGLTGMLVLLYGIIFDAE